MGRKKERAAKPKPCRPKVQREVCLLGETSEEFLGFGLHLLEVIFTLVTPAFSKLK